MGNKEGWIDGVWYSGCDKHKSWKIGCKVCEAAMDRAADGLLSTIEDGTIILDTRPHKVNR
jgi:hypothetical protein